MFGHQNIRYGCVTGFFRRARVLLKTCATCTGPRHAGPEQQLRRRAGSCSNTGNASHPSVRLSSRRPLLAEKFHHCQQQLSVPQAAVPDGVTELGQLDRPGQTPPFWFVLWVRSLGMSPKRFHKAYRKLRSGISQKRVCASHFDACSSAAWNNSLNLSHLLTYEQRWRLTTGK